MIKKFFKRILPHGLYGRAALVLIVPITIIQLVVSFSFVQRVYEDITDQMTGNIVYEIDLLLDRFLREEDISDFANILNIKAQIEGGPQEDRRYFFDIAGATIIQTLHNRVPNLAAVDLLRDDDTVHLTLDTQRGVLHLSFPRERVAATNPHQLLVLIVFFSALMTFVAYLFFRNQLKPILKLAQAAEAFGRGHHLDYRLGGPDEVRSAGKAFLNMRERIVQHQEQRTMMLNGVSHDLRTPMTRLRLGLSMSGDTEENKDMASDLDEMERLIDSFLDFAGSGASEEPEPANLVDIVQHAVDKSARSGGDVTIGNLPGEPMVLVIKKLAVERALDNLVGNALRYGNRAIVSLQVLESTIRISVEDDGPGIAHDKRAEALKPFSRLDSSRNQNQGGGVGLGLPIAQDIAFSHGGRLLLEESREYGGLLAVLELPKEADFAYDSAFTPNRREGAQSSPKAS